MLFLTYMDSLSSKAMVVICPLVLLIFSQFAGSDSLEYLHRQIEQKHQFNSFENKHILYMMTFAAHCNDNSTNSKAFICRSKVAIITLNAYYHNTPKQPRPFETLQWKKESGTHVLQTYEGSSSSLALWAKKIPRPFVEELVNTRLLCVPTWRPSLSSAVHALLKAENTRSDSHLQISLTQITTANSWPSGGSQSGLTRNGQSRVSPEGQSVAIMTRDGFRDRGRERGWNRDHSRVYL